MAQPIINSEGKSTIYESFYSVEEERVVYFESFDGDVEAWLSAIEKNDIALNQSERMAEFVDMEIYFPEQSEDSLRINGNDPEKGNISAIEYEVAMIDPWQENIPSSLFGQNIVRVDNLDDYTNTTISDSFEIIDREQELLEDKARERRSFTAKRNQIVEHINVGELLQTSCLVCGPNPSDTITVTTECVRNIEVKDVEKVYPTMLPVGGAKGRRFWNNKNYQISA